MRLGHVIYPMIEGLSYATFSLVYWALGGTGAGGTEWIYPMLDWAKPGTAALTVLGCAVGEVSNIAIIISDKFFAVLLIIHPFTWLLTKQRQMHHKYFAHLDRR